MTEFLRAILTFLLCMSSILFFGCMLSIFSHYNDTFEVTPLRVKKRNFLIVTAIMCASGTILGVYFP